MKALEDGKGARNAAGFTTVGKPKMAQKQYNSPMSMYSEEMIEEIMRDGTLGYVKKSNFPRWNLSRLLISFSGKPVDFSNLMNPTGKEFDHQASEVLQLILERSK